MDNIELSISKKVYELIVDYAFNFQLGARGLRSICEKLFLDALYELPSSQSTIKKFSINLAYAKEKLKGIEFSHLKEAI